MDAKNSNENRFVIFPLKYQEIYKAYKKAESLQWSDDEINLSHDKVHWKELSVDERYFISHILAFFAASDGIVTENLALRFYNDVQIPEARAFYSFQMYIETVHSIVYSKIIDTLIDDHNERYKLFNAIETLPAVQKKAQWALKWISSNENFDIRLIAFAIVEGVFFSGSFSAIFWIRDRHKGKFPGTMQANELIMRDEGLHQDFAVLLFKTLDCHVSQDTICEIFKEAVEIEIQFMKEALPNKLLGMNIDMMTEHIKYVANRLLKQLGYDPIYENAKQPFTFMDNISIPTVANFFEPSRPTEYNKGNKYSSNYEAKLEFNEEDEF